ncbi:hypothetical protein ACQP08_01330 [Micromonospora zamorensis]|uniref:hypothetical protein n=1 Tax=Micromonospora zamorensis TaxID=709883 RepID=UPI003D912DE6
MLMVCGMVPPFVVSAALVAADDGDRDGREQGEAAGDPEDAGGAGGQAADQRAGDRHERAVRVPERLGADDEIAGHAGNVINHHVYADQVAVDAPGIPQGWPAV